MANELQYYGDPSSDAGLTIVARVYDNAGAQVGSDAACTEVGSLAIYRGDMPTAGAGQYGVRFFDGTTLKAQSTIGWDGSAEITLTSINAKVDTLQADISAILADTSELQTNQSNFATATGFATPSDVTSSQAAVIAEVQQSEADVIAALPSVSGLATSAEISALNDLSVADVASELATYGAATGADLTAAQAAIQADIAALNNADISTLETRVGELWQLQGLDAANAMTVTPSARTVGSIAQAITGDGTTTSTVTRSP